MMKKGFTLIELLAIIIILGIIILVAVPSMIESNKVANSNETKNFNEALNTACKTYAAVNPSATSVDVGALLDGGYLKDSLKLPGSNANISTMRSTSISISAGQCNYSY